MTSGCTWGGYLAVEVCVSRSTPRLDGVPQGERERERETHESGFGSLRTKVSGSRCVLVGVPQGLEWPEERGTLRLMNQVLGESLNEGLWF